MKMVALGNRRPDGKCQCRNSMWKTRIFTFFRWKKPFLTIDNEMLLKFLVAIATVEGCQQRWLALVCYKKTGPLGYLKN